MDKGIQPLYNEFIKLLKNNKQDIFHEDDVPGQFMGPIHALALQLYAKGIIRLAVSDSTKVGTDKLNNKHIVVLMASGIDEDGFSMPALFLDSYWEESEDYPALHNVPT